MRDSVPIGKNTSTRYCRMVSWPLSFFPFLKKLACSSNLSIYILDISSSAGEAKSLEHHVPSSSFFGVQPGGGVM